MDLQSQGRLCSVHGFQALLAAVLQLTLAKQWSACPKGPEPALLALQQAVADGGACFPTNIDCIVSTTPVLQSAVPSALSKHATGAAEECCIWFSNIAA